MDNAKRSARFLIQALLASIATGGLSKLWETHVASHPVDPTVQVGMTLILGAIIVWAQDTLEDNTGKGVFLPEDRLVGDAVLGKGVGAKKLLAGTLSRNADQAIAMMPSYQHAGEKLHRHDQARY